MSTYLVVYTMDDWQNNQQGHHNHCKKREMEKDKSLLGATDIVFVFMGWHLGSLILLDSCYLLEFAFTGTNMKSWSPLLKSSNSLENFNQ